MYDRVAADEIQALEANGWDHTPPDPEASARTWRFRRSAGTHTAYITATVINSSLPLSVVWHVETEGGCVQIPGWGRTHLRADTATDAAAAAWSITTELEDQHRAELGNNYRPPRR